MAYLPGFKSVNCALPLASVRVRDTWSNVTIAPETPLPVSSETLTTIRLVCFATAITKRFTQAVRPQPLTLAPRIRRCPPNPFVSITNVDGLVDSTRPAELVQSVFSLAASTGMPLQVKVRLRVVLPSLSERGTPPISHVTRGGGVGDCRWPKLALTTRLSLESSSGRPSVVARASSENG